MPHVPGHKKKRKQAPLVPGTTAFNEAKLAKTDVVKSVTFARPGGAEETFFGDRAKKFASQKGFQKLVEQGEARSITEREFERQQALSPQERELPQIQSQITPTFALASVLSEVPPRVALGTPRAL